MIYPATTFKAQKLSICNRYMQLFRDEHNAHPDLLSAEILVSELNAMLPVKFHSFRLIYLATIWGNVLAEIPEKDRVIIDLKFKAALQAVRKFGSWQRNHYRPTKDRLGKERDTARAETRQDVTHNPTLDDFSMVNGKRRMNLPSKNPHVNEATNTAFAERFLHLNPNASREYVEAANEAIAEAKKQAYESEFWDEGLDMESMRLSVDVPHPPDPLQDFNTYTLTQTAGKLAIPASNTVAFTNYTRGDDGIVYKQGFSFGDFEHLVDVHLTASSPAVGAYNPFLPWAIANAAGTRKELVDASSKFLSALYLYNGVNNFLQLREDGGGLGVIDVYTFGIGYDSHYLTPGRSGTTGTLDIYSDINRLTVLDNLIGTVGNNTYDTVYGFQALGDAVTTAGVTGSIQNLDLQQVAAFQAAWARNSNQIIGAGVVT